jgi:hypothetical protein
MWHSGDNTISASGDFRAPIFYDSDNTVYYVDPSGGSSRLNYLYLGEAAYSSSSSYVGLKTELQSGANDYMIISGKSDGNTYVSAKNGDEVLIRGGGNNSSNQIEVPDGSSITAKTSTFNCTGDIVAYSSDKRLKENISNISNPIDKIKQLNGVNYSWKDIVEVLGFRPLYKNDIGLIAQEVQAVLPDAVRPAPFDTDKEGNSRSGENYLTVQYEKLVPLLIEAVKELSNKVEELENKLNGTN